MDEKLYKRLRDAARLLVTEANKREERALNIISETDVHVTSELIQALWLIRSVTGESQFVANGERWRLMWSVDMNTGETSWEFYQHSDEFIDFSTMDN